MRDRHRGGAHVIVAGKDGGRRLRQIQQLLGGLEAGAIGEQTLADQRFVDGDTRFPERGLDSPPDAARSRSDRDCR